MTTVVVVAMLVLIVMWAVAWALPPHRNCRECGTDRDSRAARFDQDAENFAAWHHQEEDEDVSRHWTHAHQPTGQPARAWCSTCSWEWEARMGEDLADADAAMQEHRRNQRQTGQNDE